MDLTWYGCDLATGQIVEELPGITTPSISARLCAYTSSALSLPIPGQGSYGAPPLNWMGATEQGRSMIVAVLDDAPIWGGIVLRPAGGSAASVTLSCVSLEGYLDHRYVGDHDFASVDEALITASLVDEANTEGIGFIIDAPATGTPRDRSYRDQEDKTTYSALRELSGVIDGPEWTVVLGWANSTHTAVSKTLLVRRRIGYPSAAPNAVYATGSANAVLSSQGGSEATYTQTKDYSSGKGANHIVATSSGEGDTRPQSAPARAEDLIAAGWPRWEYRFEPAPSITEQATLDGHAQQALSLMRFGITTIDITARADAYPRLGTEWSLGDDIGYELTGHMHPNGLTGVGRAVGWDLNPQSGIVTPILLAPGEEVVSS